MVSVYYTGKPIPQEPEPTKEQDEPLEPIAEMILKTGAWEKLSVEELSVKRFNLNYLKVGEASVVKATVKYLDYSGSYMAIFKVSKDGVTHYLEVKNSFNGDVMITWEPTERGVYTIEMFAWTSLDNPIPLGPVVSVSTMVNIG